MKSKKKIRTFQLDWISFLVLIVILIALGIAIGIWTEQFNLTTCEENPFIYGSQMLEKKYDAKFVGSGYFMTMGSPIISFDSTNMTVDNSRYS